MISPKDAPSHPEAPTRTSNTPAEVPTRTSNTPLSKSSLTAEHINITSKLPESLQSHVRETNKSEKLNIQSTLDEDSETLVVKSVKTVKINFKNSPNHPHKGPLLTSENMEHLKEVIISEQHDQAQSQAAMKEAKKVKNVLIGSEETADLDPVREEEEGKLDLRNAATEQAPTKKVRLQLSPESSPKATRQVDSDQSDNSDDGLVNF